MPPLLRTHLSWSDLRQVDVVDEHPKALTKAAKGATQQQDAGGVGGDLQQRLHESSELLVTSRVTSGNQC